MSGTAAAISMLSLFLAAPLSAAPCPAGGGVVAIELLSPPGAESSIVNLTGELVEPSCEGDETLATNYAMQVDCANDATCTVTGEGLTPGLWVHRVFVAGGEGAGQLQARRALVLDREAGSHNVRWQLFRTVVTVTDLDDSAACEGCLRRALELSGEADKPMLIGFDTSLAGDIVLAEPLPALGVSHVTVDGLDFDGIAHRRGIDANGLSQPALRITGESNRVIGLRLANSGGNSDVLLIDGAAANGNRIESVQIIGRTREVCELRGVIGCLLEDECVTPGRLAPNGDCGDDGIAVRQDAGRIAVNRLIDVDVSGAFDKGVKVSEGGVAVIESSRVHHNADGGIQATLGGTLTALENYSDGNRGTRSANGIAANGPRLDGSDPAFLSTRGNLLRGNSLRGLSVRSLSHAVLRDDYACGNGTVGTGAGFGLAVLDAAGFAATAEVRGVALVNGIDGGVSIMGTSHVDLGTRESPGHNAFGLNGVGSTLVGPKQIRNHTALPVNAVGNYWQSCGPTYDCAEIAVLIGGIHSPNAAVDIVPAFPNAQLPAPVITEIRPMHARAGDLVRIYGEGFDAIGAAAQDPECDGGGRPCRASDANCVIIDRVATEIIAATPTMLVIRAPFTCVAPVRLAARTRYSRGYARAQWCTVEE